MVADGVGFRDQKVAGSNPAAPTIKNAGSRLSAINGGTPVFWAHITLTLRR
jgi:hypothetical protein